MKVEESSEFQTCAHKMFCEADCSVGRGEPLNVMFMSVKAPEVQNKDKDRDVYEHSFQVLPHQKKNEFPSVSLLTPLE